MGMTGWQKFWRVELPLAAAAGDVRRTARAGAGVGDSDHRRAGRGPGLGRVITDGFFRTNYGKGIAGAVVVAAVALVLELLAAPAQHVLNPVPGDRSSNRKEGMSVPGPTVTEDAGAVGDPSHIRTRVAAATGHRRKANAATTLPRRGPRRRQLLTFASCGDDDLDSNADDDNSSSSSESAATDQGPLTIAGQYFPEAALVASMYDQLLTDAGYTVDVKLVDSRDAYMPTFPDSVDVVPEYVGGIVNFLNSRENGASAEPSRRATASSSRPTGRSCSSRRHHPARHLAGHRHQRLLRHAGLLRRKRRHEALRPRGRLGGACRGSRLRGPARLRGRSVRRLRHRHHRGAAPRLRQRPDLPGRDRRRGRAGRDQHDRRHPGGPGTGGARGRQGDPARTEPRAGRSSDFLAEHPDIEDVLNSAHGRADDRGAHRAQRGSPSTGRSRKTSPPRSSRTRACSKRLRPRR